MGLREIRSDPEVLSHAINDGINCFVREVLIAKGLLNQDEYEDRWPEIEPLKRSIIRQFVDRWKISQINDQDE